MIFFSYVAEMRFRSHAIMTFNMENNKKRIRISPERYSWDRKAAH